jgi:hypothetical protein
MTPFDRPPDHAIDALQADGAQGPRHWPELDRMTPLAIADEKLLRDLIALGEQPVRLPGEPMHGDLLITFTTTRCDHRFRRFLPGHTSRSHRLVTHRVL